MKAFLFSLIISSSILGFTQSNSNWLQTNTNGHSNYIYSIGFVDNLTGYASSLDKLLVTSDGGQNWSYSNLIQGQIGFSEIFKKGDSLIIFTTDSFSYSGYYSLNTKDSSQTLNYTSLNENSNYLGSLKIIGSQYLGLVNQELIITPDIKNKTVIKGNQIESFSIHNGFISCSNRTHIFFSSDTGQTWDSASYNNMQQGVQKIQTHYGGSDTLYSIGRTFPARDLISFDRGNNWTDLAFFGGGRKPLQYYFLDNKYIIGNFHGVILTSSDYGMNFTPDTIFNTSSFNYSIYQHSDSTFFFYGHGGVIYKTNNAGGLVGLQEQEKLENQIQIYPNPAKDIIHLNYISDIKIERIEIYNLEGKLIKRFANRKQELDISEIASGNYILKLETKTERFSKKIIIQ